MSTTGLVLAVGLSLAAGDASPTPAPGNTSLPPLIEVHRTRFEPAFAMQANYRKLAFSPSAPIVYAISSRYLFVVDALSGARLDVLDLGEFLLEGYDGWRLRLSVAGGTERLVLSNGYGTALWVLSLADPAHPVLESSLPAESYPDVDVVPGRTQALVVSLNAVLVDFVTGERFDFVRPVQYGTDWRSGAVGGTAERPVLAIHASLSGPDRDSLLLYALEDGLSPVLLSRADIPEPSQGFLSYLLVDRRGEIVIASYYADRAGHGKFEVRDVATGYLLSSFQTPGLGYGAVLVEGGGERVLAVADRSGVDLMDLSDPSHPALRGRIEASLYWSDESRLAASDVAPILFVAAPGDGEVLAVDVRTATIAGRWHAGGPAPVSIAIGEGAGGRRDAAVLSRRLSDGQMPVPGGISELDLLDVSIPSSPELRGRFDSVFPTKVEGFVTVEGGQGVVADTSTNVILLFRLSDGAVLHTTGFHSSLYNVSDYYYTGMLRAAGSTVLAFSSRRYEVFEVHAGRLVSRAREELEVGVEIRDVTVLHEGTAIIVTSRDLRTHLPDGRKGVISLPLSPRDLQLSPSGDFAFVGSPSSPFSGGGDAVMVDLSEPAQPKLLWQGLVGYSSAIFLEDGDRIFATFGHGPSWFDTGLFDVRSGAPLGEPGDPMDQFFYHTVTSTYGRGTEARVVLWILGWFGVQTVLFDAGSTTPRLLVEIPEHSGSFSSYLRRDGGGWYELLWGFREEPDRILVSDASGAQSEGLNPAGSVLWFYPHNLRWGFFAATEAENGYEAPDIVVWRDTALNRPPVAKAGGDRVVECDGRDGTPAVLDGSGSSDPDSTPGTSDDIASYEWTVDGYPAGKGPAVTASLSLGPHTASLRVEDLLGLSSTDGATVEVEDTLAPSVTLALEPVLEGGHWTGQWAPSASAGDRCDGDLAPADELLLAPGAAVAPVTFRRGTALAFEVRKGKTGIRVVLLGPAEDKARALWADVAAAGGFALADGEPVGLGIAPAAGGGSDADLLARYEVADGGRLLRAKAFGPESDLVVEASASDAAGHAGSARVSVRETLQALCAAAPPGVSCLGS